MRSIPWTGGFVAAEMLALAVHFEAMQDPMMAPGGKAPSSPDIASIAEASLPPPPPTPPEPAAPSFDSPPAPEAPLVAPAAPVLVLDELGPPVVELVDDDVVLAEVPPPAPPPSGWTAGTSSQANETKATATKPKCWLVPAMRPAI
jgi:hypothetical protein